LNGLKNSWVFPAVQSIHLVGIALLVGTILIVDLHRLGYGLRHRVNELNRWTRIGAAVMFVTGPILFAADVPRYLNNPAFRLKMVFLLLAVSFHFAVRDRMSPKLAALISMALWTCVVLGGRAIADFDI
jgi:hypothetical protein